ncbi:hypothetical protein BBJ28_00025685 [Nothophytophthora sp. Chile5]|nr:hypothetical protein BBJ28_00025685 [Nothophytophthora sp. Chile5]
METPQEQEQRSLRVAASEEVPQDAKEQGATQAAAESVPDGGASSPACEQDVAAYCQMEANVLALFREAPDVVETKKLLEAVRKVHLCMVTHADVLSVDCMNTLSADTLTTPALAASVPANTQKPALSDDTADEDSSMEINIYYSRHHEGAGHALRSGGAMAANHVQTGAIPDVSNVLTHPLTWAFVLPFFAIGLYATVTRAATFIRRRREERRIESKQYMPVN